MWNKIKKYLIFFIYTWLIYNTYAIFLIAYKFEGLNIFYDIGMILGYYSPLFTGMLLVGLGYNFFECPPAVTLIVLLVAIPCLLWWAKQTIYRAWMIGFFGSVFGQMGVLCVSNIDHGHPMSVFWMTNGFFYLLVFLNINRKESFPNSRFGNAIVKALKWPCLRT